jgi:hypothetical protein
MPAGLHAMFELAGADESALADASHGDGSASRGSICIAIPKPAASAPVW